MERSCPHCKKTIYYKNKFTYKYANDKNSSCRSCRWLNDDFRNKHIERIKKFHADNPDLYKGENNPFYGKKHSEETKEKIRKVDKSYTQKQSFKDSSKRVGKENGMYKKTNYMRWIELYGVEEADRRETIRVEKLKIASSGANNPMFGKPSPPGSGNGYSGWYRGHFFRSMLELNYIIYLDRFGFDWKTAENNSYKIEYTDEDGNIRNYYPDIIVNNHYLVEVKPISLTKTVRNKIKTEAAINFCSKNKLEFRVVSPPKMKQELIIKLYNNKIIKFTDRYEKKFLEKFYGQNSNFDGLTSQRKINLG